MDRIHVAHSYFINAHTSRAAHQSPHRWSTLLLRLRLPSDIASSCKSDGCFSEKKLQHTSNHSVVYNADHYGNDGCQSTQAVAATHPVSKHFGSFRSSSEFFLTPLIGWLPSEKTLLSLFPSLLQLQLRESCPPLHKIFEMNLRE